MAIESKLEAARRTGSLTNVIGALREQEETANEEEPVREQLDIVDASIRVAAGLSATGTKGAERRQAISAVQVGKTVTAQGVARTVLTREQKIARVKAWAKSMSEEARTAYMTGEKYAALSENAQDVIAEAFTELENDEYSTPVDVSGFDFKAEPVDVDLLPEDETEAAGDSFEGLGEDVDDAFEAAEWQAER
jgi:HAMP domain-containing protein